MYSTKKFSALKDGGYTNEDITWQIDQWLNSFKNPYIVGYQTLGLVLVITIWERPEMKPASRQTIDPIPEEPTIHL